MVSIALPAAVLSVFVNAHTGGAAANLTRLDKRLKSTASTGEAMGARVATASKYAALGLAAGAAGSVYAAAKFESAFAEVRKTVDTNEKGFKRIEKGLRGLATQIPVSANELAYLAGEAGALGVKSRDIVKFTKTASMLGTTTNLSSDKAASSLAKLKNIMDSKDRKAFERMGATLVDLGNKGASTEDEITEMALRIAGAGKTLGLTEAQVLGLSSSLANVGIRAEMGGSAVSRVLLQMQEAIAKGGPEVQNFAEITGVSIREFERQFAQDAPRAIALFAEGLGRVHKAGEPIISTLKGVELGEIRVRDTLLRIAGNTKQFTDAQNVANNAWKANTALTNEARQRYKTFESQLILLKNSVIETGIGIGQQLMPDLKAMVKILRDPKLTLDEKIGLIGERLNGMIEKWAPKVAEAGTKLGFELAKGFGKAFLDSPIWTQLAVGGFLLAKFGGVGAFGKLGSKSGRAWGAGFVGAILAMELADQIKQIVEGHKLDAPTSEMFAMDLGKFFANPKTSIEADNKVKFSTAVGDLIFNASTRRVVETQGQKLGAFVGSTLSSKLASKIKELESDVGARTGRVADVFGRKLRPLPGISERTGEGIKRGILPKLDALATQGGERSAIFADRVSGPFGSLNANVGAALRAIIGNTRNALDALGVKGALRQFALKNPEFVYGTGMAKNQAKQDGGFIVPGTGSGDKFQTALTPGWFILNREATGAYGFRQGGAVPVALEPGERAFSPPEVKAMGGAPALEAMNQSVRRFQKGGEIGKPQLAGPAGPLLGMGQGAVDNVYTAANRYLAKHEPKEQSGASGRPGFSGPPPGMKQLGDNAWVDSHTYTVARYIASKFGSTISSDWRSAAENAAANGSPTSSHMRGTPANPGAFDMVPPSAALQSWVGAHVAGLTENDIHDYGSGLHNHIAFFRLGGVIQKLVEGGWVKTGYTTYDVDGPGAGGNLMSGAGYAELGTATSGGAGTGQGFIAKALGMSGELPFDYPLDVKIGNTAGRLYKRDRGYGQGDPYYSIDIHRLGWDEVGLSGNSKGSAWIRPGDGSAALSADKKQANEGKERKANYETRLAALQREVDKAKSLPAKQSKLWRLIKFWGRVGMFDKDEHAHIIESVTNAASQVKPSRAVDVLSNLASYAKTHGEITGQDPSNFRSLGQAIERAQERGRKQREKAVEKQKKRVEAIHQRVEGRISQRAAFPDIVANLSGLRRGADSGEEFASQLVSLEPENVTDAYVDRERRAYGQELNQLLSWRNSVVGAREYATAEIGRFERQIEEIEALRPDSPAAARAFADRIGGGKVLGGLIQKLAGGGPTKGQSAKAFGNGKPETPKSADAAAQYKKVAYKIPALEEAVKNAKTMRDDTWAAELEEIQGLAGPAGLIESLPSEPTAGSFGGRIFEVQNAIRELALKVPSATGGEDLSQQLALTQELLRQANQRTAVSELGRNTIAQFDTSYPVGSFAGLFGSGGSLKAGQWGIAGETGRPEIVHGPAHVFSPTESNAMMAGSAAGPLVIEELHFHEDGRVTMRHSEREIEVVVQKVLRNGGAIGRRTPGGVGRP